MTTASQTVGVRRKTSSEWGWYLYGITGCGPDNGLPDTGQQLERIRFGDLDAIVQRVPRADFSEQVLHDRLTNPQELEAIVRQHHAVVAALHKEQAILPVKFGCVYASTEDLAQPLEQSRDTLHDQLELVEGCDEWAIHVYVDRQALQQQTLARESSLEQLQQELATAPPGRAYMLGRKLKEELTRATEQAELELARACYARLAQHAVAEHASQPGRTNANENADEYTEVVRAAFLVRRADCNALLGEAAAVAHERSDARCDSSGPWPPYSFVGLAEEDEP